MHALLETGLTNAVMAGVLAVAAAAVSRLVRRPALTHTLWLLVLLKLVTPVVVPVPVPWPTDTPADEAPAASGPAPAPAGVRTDAPSLPLPARTPRPEVEVLAVVPAAVAVPTSEPPAADEAPAVDRPLLPAWWREGLLLAWLAGSALWFARAALQVVRFQRLVRHARPPPATLQGRAEGLARALGLASCPPVRLVAGAVSPMVWAVGGRPRLLFPARLLERLDQDQQAALLAHELAHVLRLDHWVRLFELAVTGLYWWHPVVWWARHEVHEAEEQCCDAWAVWALGGSGRPYALALLQTVEFFSGARSALPVAASGIGQVPHLRRRLTMIMQGQTPRTLSWAGGLAVLAFGLMLPAVPSRGQQAPAAVPNSTPRAEAPAADPVQQQIDALKKAIDVLEKQKQTGPSAAPAAPAGAPVVIRALPGGPYRVITAQVQADGAAPKKKADPAEVKKARDEAKKAAEDVQARRRELVEAERKHQKAIARLAQLGESAGYFIYQMVPQGGETGRNYYSQIYAYPTAAPQVSVAVPPPQAPATQRPGAHRGSDLEQKLDRLMKEVDELRREIRRGGSSSNSVPPPGPTPVPPAGTVAPPAPLTVPVAEVPAPVPPPAAK